MDSGSLLSGDIPLAFYHLAGCYLSLSWAGRLGWLGRIYQKTEEGGRGLGGSCFDCPGVCSVYFFSTFLKPVPRTISGLL